MNLILTIRLMSNSIDVLIVASTKLPGSDCCVQVVRGQLKGLREKLLPAPISQ